MKASNKFVLYGCGLLLACFVSATVSLEESDPVEKEFLKFILIHKKPYSRNSPEYAQRLENFKASHKRALLNNNLHDGIHPDMTYGITKFSDLHPKEFEKLLLHHLPSSEAYTDKFQLKNNANTHIKLKKKRQILSYTEDPKLPEYVDWREKHAITPVKNQLSCGACWAFSTVGTVESMLAIKTNQLKEISVQQVIDCARNGNLGCIGGDTCSALKWMSSSNVSLVEENLYPLTLKNGECHTVNFPGIRIAANFTCLNLSADEESLMELLAFHGPVVAAVDAITWQDYLGGVIQFNCLDRINHAVQIVGYDRRGKIPFYIIKNSWGSDFGIDGYVHVAIGKNLCGITREVSALDVIV